MEKSSRVYVGIDAYKASIEVTLAEQGGELRRLRQIGGDRGSLLKMARKLESKGGWRMFVYEAGPCGFWIHRELAARGGGCTVVSPRSGAQARRGPREDQPARQRTAGESWVRGESEAIHMPDVRDEAICAPTSTASACMRPCAAASMSAKRPSDCAAVSPAHLAGRAGPAALPIAGHK